MIAQPPLVNAPELDQLSLDDLRALIARTSGTPADWHAALVDGQLSGRTRRAIVRGLLRSQTLDAIRSPASGKLALAELGALIDATTWLEPAQVHEVTAVGGKIPVRWTDEDLIVTISVCPDEPATDKVVIYAVIAGNPPLAEVVSGLRGEVGGMHVVRELGVFEDPPDGGRRLVPVLAAIVACRRAICDRETRSHTLVDILIDLPVGILPTTVMFDVYLQLREICPNVRLTLELLDGETVLSSGTLGLQRAATAGAPEITAALDIALPSMEATVSRTGVHLLRVRSGDTMLGEHPLNVRIAT